MAGNLIAEDGSVAIRVTEERFSKALCRRMHVPVVSTSANVSGEPTPKNFSEISQAIVGAVDYVVRYRQDDTAKPNPSSIIKLCINGEVKVIRE